MLRKTCHRRSKKSNQYYIIYIKWERGRCSLALGQFLQKPDLGVILQYEEEMLIFLSSTINCLEAQSQPKFKKELKHYHLKHLKMLHIL
jgi:hypothetical protein